MKKFIIWSSDINIDNWDFEEEEEFLSEYKKFEIATELNYEYLNDERCNLNKCLPTMIIAFARVGRWDGVVSCCKFLNNNLNSCLYPFLNNTDTRNEWYVNEDSDLCCNEAHHDGNNFVIYRGWKKNITADKKRKVTDAWLTNQEDAEMLINKTTIPLGQYVADIYGWSFT